MATPGRPDGPGRLPSSVRIRRQQPTDNLQDFSDDEDGVEGGGREFDTLHGQTGTNHNAHPNVTFAPSEVVGAGATQRAAAIGASRRRHSVSAVEALAYRESAATRKRSALGDRSVQGTPPPQVQLSGEPGGVNSIPMPTSGSAPSQMGTMGSNTSPTRPRAYSKATAGMESGLARVSEDPASPSAVESHNPAGFNAPPTTGAAIPTLHEVRSTEEAAAEREMPAALHGDPAASSTQTQQGPTIAQKLLSPFTGGNRQTESSGPNAQTEKESSSAGGGGGALAGLGGFLSRKMSNVGTMGDGASTTRASNAEIDEDTHTDDVADYLDVIDPEVGTLSYLSNIQNSIFIPNIPALYDRRPTHNLPRTARRRAYTVTNRGDQRRRDSVTSGESGQRSENAVSAMEEGRPAEGTLPVRPGYAGGAKPSRNRSALSRMSSAIGLGPKKEEDEEIEDTYDPEHIKEWSQMDEDERNELDEHVRLLLTKKSKFKRGAKGFWAFVKTPMGFIMTLYGLLITFWGSAIVIFIFGWIHAGHRQRYWIEICDQILCALFAAVGLGFAPFRAVDTYRMIYIAKYHHLTWERRTKLGLGTLHDPNDLPRPIGDNQVREEGEQASVQDDAEPKRSDTGLSDSSQKRKEHRKHQRGLLNPNRIKIPLVVPSYTPPPPPTDLTPISEQQDPGGNTAPQTPAGNGDSTSNLSGSMQDARRKPLKRNDSIQSELVKDREDIVVLTKEEQDILEHHQRKFHSSHTFYRYHETATHHAFPLDLMIVIVCLLDCHSLLQGALGGCTWGIKYTHRPTALTATLISCSLSCNAVAGLLIYIGGRRTKKTEEVERRLRIALENEAKAKIERKRARLAAAKAAAEAEGSPTDGSAESSSVEGKESEHKRNHAHSNHHGPFAAIKDKNLPFHLRHQQKEKTSNKDSHSSSKKGRASEEGVELEMRESRTSADRLLSNQASSGKVDSLKSTEDDRLGRTDFAGKAD